MRQKRGNCGTPLAHKGCLLRPATAAASGSPRTPGGEGLPAPLRNPLSSLKPGKKGRDAGVNAVGGLLGGRSLSPGEAESPPCSHRKGAR